MPIQTSFSLPGSPDALPVGNDPGSKLYLTFVTSDDPATRKSWCPDVRAAMPAINAAFSGERRPTAALVEVGQMHEWRDKSNVFRTKWNVNNIPTIVRFERVDGGITETGRLVEAEILDEKRLGEFIGQ